MALILAKILVTFLTVVLLATVAVRLSPRHAGLLAGFPLGTGIALYFFGWQQGEQFAADSAIYSLSGLGAAITLAWGYWQVIRRWPQMHWLPLAVCAGIGCFLLTSSLLQVLPANRMVSLAVVIAAILLFRHLFRHIEEKTVHSSSTSGKKRWWSGQVATLLFRASMAASTILMITALAELLGPDRAGLLAAFPVSFFPLILILHLQHGAEILSATLKHYPDGIGSLAVYCLAVSYLYPLLGLHWGTIVSLGCSVLYLFLYGQLHERRAAG